MWRSIGGGYPTSRKSAALFSSHGSLPAGRFFPADISSGRQFAALDRLLEKTRSGPFHLRRPEIADIVVEAIAYNRKRAKSL